MTTFTQADLEQMRQAREDFIIYGSSVTTIKPNGSVLRIDPSETKAWPFMRGINLKASTYTQEDNQ